MLDKIAKQFDFQQRALNLRAYRAEVIASNVANADTPYYKAMDFDFKQALKSADEASRKLGLDTTDPRHIAMSEGDSHRLGAQLMYRSQVQPSLDGNTVDMDVERAAFTENALQYQTTLTFLNRRISSLNDAIRGGQ
ncbi:flagellar basal body rod protein FlgB [Gulbenkiania mobilis]|uniref:Flagellar basal body rod protein FlgB n=1 Tax=Gulbenkiania mobilis TaxID=397457 RepID=A0ABY2CZL4_GULMO|nr:flagellar basal body rod protein FlgB [Gulbenkiania mobilis]TCW29891.1 flagellar basal-body rod protein FlgB [Gulbenkiania mobilis]